MNVIEILQNNWVVFLAMGVVMVLSLVWNMLRLKKMKSGNKNFLEQYPDAAKIYLTNKALVATEAVQVITVNGDTPNHFVENGKTGFYVLPGRCTVELNYTYSKPSVVHKTVTESTGVVEKILETEPYKTYFLGFDRTKSVFTFEKHNI